MVTIARIALVASSVVTLTAAQTFQRLGGCPSEIPLPRTYPASLTLFQLWDAFFLLIKPTSSQDNTLIFVLRYGAESFD
jgi:hypothetical protein